MAKRRNNKPHYIILPNHSPNIFATGGISNIRSAGSGSGITSNYNKSFAMGGSSGGADWGGAAGSAANMLDSILNNAAVADTPQVDAAILLLNSIQPTANTNVDLMSEWSSYKDMGKVSVKDVGGKSNAQIAAGTGKAALAGAAAGTAIMPGIGTVVGGVVGAVGGLVGGLIGRKKANKKKAEANRKIAEANENALNQFDNKIGTIDSYNDMSAMASYFNFGGALHTQGAEYGQGLTYVDEGGLHEENPGLGVLIGMDELGNPNLLEEGEVKFNNYVFSNRLKPTKQVLKGVNMKERYSKKTFADIAKLVSRESEERPNDPISRLGLEDAMSKLMIAQEEIRGDQMKKEINKNMFKCGGGMKTSKKPNMFPYGGSLYDALMYGNYDPRTPMVEDRISANNNNFVSTPQAGSGALIPSYAGLNNINGGFGNTAANSNAGGYNVDNSLYLRYAPVLGSGLALAGDLLGITNKKDYTHADSVLFDNVDFLPIGNYMTYNPLDRNYYTNQLRSQAAAGRSAIVNQSGGNRATATAGLLASDYNSQGRMGDLIRMAEEYNLNQRQKVEEFNRATNMYNSEAGLKSAMFNSEGQYNARATRARMRQEVDDKISAAKSANYSNFFDSLGDVGREGFSRNMINSNRAWYYGIDSTGSQYYKPTKKKRGGSLTYSKI